MVDVRTISSQPEFLGCMDNQILLPIVIRCVRLARARTPLKLTSPKINVHAIAAKTHNEDARLVPKDLSRWKKWSISFLLYSLFTASYPICNIDICLRVWPLVTHWITVNYKLIIIANFAPVRSVSVPFLTKWCWNSVCLPCWSDDHGTLFELHGKINGKSAQHPWWHLGLLVEHLQYNKALNYWLRKSTLWVGGGGGRGRGLSSQIFTYEEGQKCWDISVKGTLFGVVVIFILLPLCTPTPFSQNQCWI